MSPRSQWESISSCLAHQLHTEFNFPHQKPPQDTKQPRINRKKAYLIHNKNQGAPSRSVKEQNVRLRVPGSWAHLLAGNSHRPVTESFLQSCPAHTDLQHPPQGETGLPQFPTPHAVASFTNQLPSHHCGKGVTRVLLSILSQLS